MGESLLTYDQIWRACLIGLEFAPTILTGFGLTWLAMEKHIKDQLAEIEFLQSLIQCQTR